MLARELKRHLDLSPLSPSFSMFGGFFPILPWNHPVVSISLLGQRPRWCPGFQKWYFLCKLPPYGSFGPIRLAAMMDTGCEGTKMQVLLLQGVWDGSGTRGNGSRGSPIWPHHARWHIAEMHPSGVPCWSEELSGGGVYRSRYITYILGILRNSLEVMCI